MKFNELLFNLQGPRASFNGLIDVGLSYKNSKEVEEEIFNGMEQCHEKIGKAIAGRKLKIAKGQKSILNKQNKNELLLKGEHNMEVLDMRKIVCIIGDNNYCDLHLAKDKKPRKFCILLGLLEKQLASPRFLRVNRNTIVNSKYIRAFRHTNRDCVILKTGEEFEVPRRKAAKLKELWLNSFI